MRCLILGAGGFIGQQLLLTLHSMRVEVIVYDRPSVISDLQARFPGIKCVAGNFATEHRWQKLLRGVDVCFHLISTMLPKTSNDAPITDVSENLIGTLHLLEAARHSRPKIIFTSSGGTIYGPPSMECIKEDHATNPLCSYGITKLAIEKYLHLYQHLHDISSVVLRIANPYGPGQKPDAIQGVIAVFMGRVLQNDTVNIWGDGSVVRDYVFVGDVVDALLSAAEYTGPQMTFNIGSGIGYSLQEILRLTEFVTNKKAQVIYLAARNFDIPKSILDISSAKAELNWSPTTSLEKGLAETFNWMTEYLNLATENSALNRRVELLAKNLQCL